MRIPTPADFRVLDGWGLVENPMAAIEDYSEEKAERRWENERHCRAHDDYETSQSTAFIRDTQAYYRSMDRPIDRTKWEFLKRRKAWFHPPVEWNRFATPGVCRILDLGCGDGDVTQRVADHVAGAWKQAGYSGFPLEIVGVDLSESRIHNARRHTSSPHEMITLRFEQSDALDGLGFKDYFFDFTLLVGLLEVLDDKQCSAVLEETSRLTARGIYVRDVLEDYPGITPRPELSSTLAEHDFDVISQNRVFEEPFIEEGSEDPLEVWPMNINQVLFAERADPVQPADRY